MNDLDRLIAIEAIRRLKAGYWRAVDSRDAKALRSVFTDDAVIDFREDMPDGLDAELPDPDSFVDIVLSSFKGVTTMHHGHEPEITIESATTASATWPMEDNLWVSEENSLLPFKHLYGCGLYRDRYVKTDEGWKIAYTTLIRVKREITR